MIRALIHAATPIVTDLLGVILLAILLALHVPLPLAIAGGILVSLGLVGYDLARRRPIPALQWTSLVLVVASGIMALVTQDARFVMVKPTVVYALIGAAMLRRGWMNRYVPPHVLHLTGGVMTVFGYLWAGLMFLTAALNLLIATLFTSHWVAFIALFPLLSKLVLFAANFIVTRAVVLRRRAAGAAPGGSEVTS